MKKILTFSLFILGVIIISGCLPESNITEAKAISAIKDKYPELNDYPSNNLPPRSIKTEKTGNGWNIAFIQEGSGRPIIFAKCFFVDDQSNIKSKSSYSPAVGEDTMAELSPKTCSPAP